MDEPKRVKLDMYPTLPLGIFQYMIGCVATSTNSTTHAKTVFKIFCPVKCIIKNVTPVCCIKQLIATRCRWIVVYEFSGDTLTASDTIYMFGTSGIICDGV
ncbi:hypothetical protein QE152_g4758 [Popillia japonica]|uniref:Uncharacterized protein n=1 Tax=Popillia japonica TaxID=7064 RepID=A0AAW1MX82_POPJA